MKDFSAVLRRLLTLVRGITRRTYVYGLFYHFVCRHVALRRDTVLLESHLGEGFFGNPRAIAEHLWSSDEYKHLSLVVVAPKCMHRSLRAYFGSARVRMCRKNSLVYCYHVATCEWLINDVTFPYYFSRRSSQKYLNTWHGTPLKSLGRRIAHHALHEIGNTQRNFLHATAMLMPNSHTERVLLQDYMMDGIWKGYLIHCGYPRNDVLYRSQSTKCNAENINIAFMPTWRGTMADRKASSEAHVAHLCELLRILDETLDPNVTMWVRLHPLAADTLRFTEFRRIKPFPLDKEPYAHLASCDALVTDYSSVIFDFVVTRRPILLYEPDAEAYRHARAFSLDPATLPFKRATTGAELADLINSLSTAGEPLSSAHTVQYAEFVHRYCPWDDGTNTERVCATFFLGQRRCDVIPKEPDASRTNILIYAGALLNNGIITSFKSLLSQLDPAQLRITVLADTGDDGNAAEAYFNSLPDTINYIPLKLAIPFMPGDMVRWAVCFFLHRRSWARDLPWLQRFWRREWARLFGSTAFDAFINFNGYSWRAAFLALGAPCPSAIFVHNDMAKEVRAKKVADARLLKLSYQQAKRVAVVREGVEEEYCRCYFDYRDKRHYTPNTLPLNYRQRASLPLVRAFKNGITDEAFARVSDALAASDTLRFINVARFSPEKGQVRLIEAFEMFHDDNTGAQLFIIGGYGASASVVRAYAQQSKAARNIFVIEGSSNPFPLMHRMNAFVLSSTYEGKPMVLFEALALRLPIVSTNIPGVAEVLVDGHGLLVDNSIAGLVEGMHAVQAGTVPCRPYDFDAHNRQALVAFEALVDAMTDRPGPCRVGTRA